MTDSAVRPTSVLERQNWMLQDTARSVEMLIDCTKRAMTSVRGSRRANIGACHATSPLVRLYSLVWMARWTWNKP
jgi:hypothetical protein